MPQVEDNAIKSANGPSRAEYDHDIGEIIELIDNMILQFKALLEHMRGQDNIDDQQFLLTLVMTCPFCGAKEEEGIMYFKKMGAWVCLTCNSTLMAKEY